MKDDDALARIREHVRADRKDDAALEAIARGEAEVEPGAELVERAQGDAEAAAMVEACRPLGDAAVDRVAAAALADRSAPRGAATPEPEPKLKPEPAPEPKLKPEPEPEPKSKPKPKPKSVVVPFLRRAAIYAGPVALAAAVLVFVGLREPAPSGRLLPDYSVVAGSQKEMRGADDARPALTLRGDPDAEFEILARPATATGKVVAFAFAMGEAEPSPVDANVELAPEGAVRIRGRARALYGAREVRVVLGTASDSITRYDDALSRARSGKSDAKVRVLVVPIVRP
jgi:hypothetical protein